MSKINIYTPLEKYLPVYFYEKQLYFDNAITFRNNVQNYVRVQHSSTHHSCEFRVMECPRITAHIHTSYAGERIR